MNWENGRELLEQTLTGLARLLDMTVKGELKGALPTKQQYVLTMKLLSVLNKNQGLIPAEISNQLRELILESLLTLRTWIDWQIKQMSKDADHS